MPPGRTLPFAHFIDVLVENCHFVRIRIGLKFVHAIVAAIFRRKRYLTGLTDSCGLSKSVDDLNLIRRFSLILLNEADDLCCCLVKAAVSK